MRPGGFSATSHLTMLSLMLLTVLLLASRGAAASNGNVDEQSLKQLFPGADAYFLVRGRQTHGWVSSKWRFGDDGTLSGNLFSSAYVADREPYESMDSGSWRVHDGQLCVRWQHWGEGRERCYRIAKAGGRDYTASGTPGLFAGPFTLVQPR